MPGVTFTAAEGGPMPSAFVAATVQVYTWPLVRPITTMGEAVPMALTGPGEQLALNEVMGLPPSDPGLKEIVTWPAPARMPDMVGAPGTAAKVTVTDRALLRVTLQESPRTLSQPL